MPTLLYGPKAGLAPPRIARPKQRKTFAADALELDAAAGTVTLRMRTGAWVKSIDRSGDCVRDERDTRAQLWVTVGDRLIVWPTSIASDELALVEIVGVAQDARTLRCVNRNGTLPTTGSVYVMRCRAGGRR